MKKLFVFFALAVPVFSLQAVEDSIGVIASDKPFSPPANLPSKSGYVELNHQCQEKNLCVPTSASIIMELYGEKICARALKTLSRSQVYNPNIPFNDFTSTFFKDLNFGISRMGFRWREASYPNTLFGLNSGLLEIKHSIDKGRPVLIDTHLYGGHTFVICGYDDSIQSLIIMDPNIPDPGIRVIKYLDLAVIWNSLGVGFNGRGALFTAPKNYLP
jgi:hypothetical protein